MVLVGGFFPVVCSWTHLQGLILVLVLPSHAATHSFWLSLACLLTYFWLSLACLLTYFRLFLACLRTYFWLSVARSSRRLVGNGESLPVSSPTSQSREYHGSSTESNSGWTFHHTTRTSHTHGPRARCATGHTNPCVHACSRTQVATNTHRSTTTHQAVAPS